MLGLDHVRCVWLLILCFILGSFAGREFRFAIPVPVGAGQLELAYAGSSGLAFAGVGVAN